MPSVLGFTFPLPPLILDSSFLYKCSRYLNKSFIGKFILIAISRYSSTVSFYSAQADSTLYTPNKSSKDYLNIGSGFFSHPHWQCLDLVANSTIYKAIQGRPFIDFIPVNLNTDSLDFLPNNTFKAIYSSHTLEHINRDRISFLFHQVLSLLSPNGVFRICVPDLLSFYNVNRSHIVLDHDDMLFFVREAFTPLYSFLISQPDQIKFNHLRNLHDTLKTINFIEFLDFLIDYSAQFGINDYGHPPDFHLSYPTESFLTEIGRKCGFTNSFRTVRGISHTPCFANKFLFDTTIPDFSLYMEFVK